MNEKINELLEQYKTSLERKLNLLQSYIDKKNDDDLFEPKWNIIDQENYSRLNVFR